MSRILCTLSSPSSSLGVLHTDVRVEGLKKNTRSSLLHTTDQGVPGTDTLATGRGPRGSSLTGVERTEAGMGASKRLTAAAAGGGAMGRCGGRGRGPEDEGAGPSSGGPGEEEEEEEGGGKFGA